MYKLYKLFIERVANYFGYDVVKKNSVFLRTKEKTFTYKVGLYW